MKNQIIDYLQITSEEYDDRLFMTYWNWCDKYGTTPNKVQELLANASVNKWWMQEWQKLEKEFCDMVAHFPKKLDQLEYQYHGFTVQIFALFPKPLIDNVKISNPDFQRKLLTNTPLFYAN